MINGFRGTECIYLENKVLEVVKTNRLELFRELKGNISIKAINNLIQSPLSDTKYIHSSAPNTSSHVIIREVF